MHNAARRTSSCAVGCNSIAQSLTTRIIAGTTRRRVATAASANTGSARPIVNDVPPMPPATLPMGAFTGLPRRRHVAPKKRHRRALTPRLTAQEPEQERQSEWRLDRCQNRLHDWNVTGACRSTSRNWCFRPVRRKMQTVFFHHGE